eukprot:CAMPEP_0198722770 /NCGR_PEP_ID=MMETSP1475-20131203/391_1 /TAXON_ID= ORGANISM="Unidentified sp., Strain CCMP1999" /NCGR_SAMPLE_ID=MMETSP1475 /ASSEMBLY_ACC=CAM_ASM_001111 /LENGTH=130 /DNA_ID=CAMNT_0044483691 /DNA_START=35 /DNA_END=424 /DNA_ORIENTATION=-
MIYDVHSQYFVSFLTQTGVQRGAGDPVARIAALKNEKPSENKMDESAWGLQVAQANESRPLHVGHARRRQLLSCISTRQGYTGARHVDDIGLAPRRAYLLWTEAGCDVQYSGTLCTVVAVSRGRDYASRS